MIVTTYRGYNLVEDANADGVRILFGTRELSHAGDIAGAKRIVDDWMNAP